jgi:hypothetical protein
MGNLSGKPEWDLDEIPSGSELTDKRAFLSSVKTGDMILFQGAGPVSGLIRCLSVCQTFSHIGMVIVHKGQALITEADAESVGFDPVRNDEHTGVQFTDLEKRLKEYDSCRIAYRRLNGKVDEGLVQGLIQYYKDIKESKVPHYNLDIGRLIRSGTLANYSKNTRGGRREYICTAWFAALLLTFNMTIPDFNPANYTLALYSLTPEHGPWMRDMEMLKHPYSYKEIQYLCF